MQPAPSGREDDETDHQATLLDLRRGNKGISRGAQLATILLLTHVMFLKAKQAPEEKHAGVSQETLAIAGLALAAITFIHMVGHGCGVIGVLGLW